MLKLSSLFTIHCNNEAISHIFLSLCGNWRGPDIQARMVVPSCEPFCRGQNLVEAIPPLLKWYYYRLADGARYKAEKRFLSDLKDFDAAYLWPATSWETFRRIKKLDRPIFLERINCFRGQAKGILDEAYRRLGLEPEHGITPEMIQEEEAEVKLADFIFCPGPEVKKSFL